MFVEFMNETVFNKNKYRLNNDDMCIVHYSLKNSNKPLTLFDADIKFKFGVNTPVVLIDELVGLSNKYELMVEAEFDSGITDCKIEMFIREESNVDEYLHKVRENLLNRSI